MDRIYNTSLKDNQLKWFCNGKFIKLNTPTWYGGTTEVLVSYMLQYTNVENYVKYCSCIIEEDVVVLGEGCYSYDFLKNNERDITFYRLFGKNGLNISRMSYDEVRDNLLEITGVDYKKYIDTCLCVDAITFNEDRHFNNLSVIKSDSGYSYAPVYDFGLSCLSDTLTYSMKDSLELNLSKVLANPFKVNFKYQLEIAMVSPILFDLNGFISGVVMTTDEEKCALDVIKIGAERTRV